VLDVGRRLLTDGGLDYIAGGVLSIPAGVEENGDLVNNPAPTAAGAWGSTFDGAPLANPMAFPNVQYDDPVFAAPDGTEIWILDVLESGVPPTPVGLATSLAGALPDQEIEVTLDRSVDESQREDLVRHLGIYTKDATEADLVDYLTGRRFFKDLPEVAHVVSAGDLAVGPTSPSQHKVSIDRLPGELAREALLSYRAIYWREKLDPKTGQKVWQSRAAEIRTVLQKAVDAYKAKHAGKFDAAGFAKFLAATPDQKEAYELLQRLAGLFRQVELLGLGPVELNISHGMLARSIRPSGVTAQELIDAIRAAPGAGGKATAEAAATASK
jgi:hypothetical protein